MVFFIITQGGKFVKIKNINLGKKQEKTKGGLPRFKLVKIGCFDGVFLRSGKDWARKERMTGRGSVKRTPPLGIRGCQLVRVMSCQKTPRFSYRLMKFFLPTYEILGRFFLPTYVDGFIPFSLGFISFFRFFPLY
jgi:hypothetical protein